MSIISNIEKSIRLIPIIYPILIFLGFYHQEVYYKHFGIEIFHYLSIYEILFSFVSIAIPILVTSIGILLYLTLIYSGGVDEQDENEDDKDDDDPDFNLIYGDQFHHFKRSIKRSIKCIKEFKVIKLFKNLLVVIKYAIALSIKISLWIFFCIYAIAFVVMANPSKERLGGENLFYDPNWAILASVVWIIMFLVIIGRRLSLGQVSSNTYSFMLIGISIIFLLFSININKKRRIEDFYSERNTLQLKFSSQDSNIETDSCLRFIGKTSNYIFLKDLNTGFNRIFSLAGIRNLQLKSE